MTDYEKLERDLLQADRAARELENTEDGGTCNFDTPVIKLENADKKRLAQLEWHVKPIEERGWKDCYFVFITLSGQGNRRTRMAEAAAKSLKANGWDASVYYEMD